MRCRITIFLVMNGYDYQYSLFAGRETSDRIARYLLNLNQTDQITRLTTRSLCALIILQVFYDFLRPMFVYNNTSYMNCVLYIYSFLYAMVKCNHRRTPYFSVAPSTGSYEVCFIELLVELHYWPHEEDSS